MSDTINRDNLLRVFNEEYQFLLDNNGNVSGAKDAAAWTDNHFTSLLPYIQTLVELRGDILATSNELAAFAFSCERLGIDA
jgi:hypothetical protein